MGYVKQIGPHTLSFEDPDLHVIVFRGEILGEHIDQMAAGPPNGLDPERYLLTLMDVSAVTRVDGSSRRAGRHKWGKRTRNFQALLGATFTMRIAIELFTRAVNLMAGWERVTLRSFTTQAEARAWLLSMAEKMRAEKA